MERDGVVGIGLTTTDETIGEAKKFAMKIDVASRTVSGNLPATIEGLPTEFDVVDEITDNGGCVNDYSYQTLRGGIPCGQNGKNGTLGCVVEYDGKKMAMTNHHIVSDDKCDTSNSLFNDIYQDNNYIGESYAVDKGLDMGLVEIENSGLSANNTIMKEDRSEVDIEGYITEDGVTWMNAYDSDATISGTETGTHSGTVFETHYTRNECNDYAGHGVKTYLNTAGGDSGSVVYGEDTDGTCLLVNLHSAGAGSTNKLDCNGDQRSEWATGAAAYRIDDEWNITWDWS